MYYLAELNCYYTVLFRALVHLCSVNRLSEEDEN